MQPLPQDFNPFALMIDPQSVIAQIEHSERLERLTRRVCRPLDKPQVAAAGDETGEQASDADATEAANEASIDPLPDQFSG